MVPPVVRRFDIEVGHCAQCRRRVQGRHVLQTSDALARRACSSVPGSSRWWSSCTRKWGCRWRRWRTRCGPRSACWSRRLSRPRAASGRPRRRAGLHGTVRAGPERARGHAGRDRLARRHRPPLALDVRHSGHDGLRDLPRPRVRRCRHGAGDRLRRRARARRVGAVSPLRRTAPNLSQPPAPAVQSNSGKIIRTAPGAATSRRSCGPASTCATAATRAH